MDAGTPSTEAALADPPNTPRAPKPRGRSASGARPVRLGPLLVGAMWLVGLRAGLLVLAGFLGSSPLAEVVLGALLVDVAAGRAGVAWAEEDVPRATLRKLAGLAAGLASGPILVALAVGVALGHVSLAAGSPNLMLLASIIGAGAQAMRDELLLRALPLRFLREANVPERAAVLFTTLLSPTAFLHTGPGAAAIALSLATGLFFSVVYVRMAGAWAVVAAHAALLVLTGPLLRGGVVEATFHHGELAEGGLAAGAPALTAAALFLGAAWWVWRRPSTAPAATSAPPR